MTPSGSGRNEGDLMESVKKLESLKTELRNIEKRREEIRAEVKETFAEINGIAPEFANPGTARRSRLAPAKPRPFQDKLMISAGRAAIQVMRQGKTQDECVDAALKAAKYCPMKHGVNELPSAAIEVIEKKIRRRFLYTPLPLPAPTVM